MTTFSLNQVGDTVFDRIKSKVGVIESIDYTANTALVKVTDSNEVLVSKLFNLQKVKLQQDSNDAEDVYIESVKDFHVAFEHPVADKPTPLTLERAVSRGIWATEEIIEFIEASCTNEEEFLQAYDVFIKGVEKAKQKSLDAKNYPQNDKDRIVAQADALTDANYFNFGSFCELGISPKPLFNIVQKSNMSKLFSNPDGTKYAKYRESDGKILKSPEFFPPEPALKAEIERQINSKQ